jgi:membrane protease YdiL (CAAX protease family)
MDRTAMSARPAAPVPLADRAVAAVLRAPVSGGLDAELLLLTVSGRGTGRARTLPVRYAAGQDALWVRPRTRRWWRDLRREAPVRVRLLGRDLAGSARVVTPAGEPAAFGAGAAALARRFPRAVPAGVLVRVAVPAVDLLRARRVTVVPGRGPLAAVRRHPVGAFFLLAFLLSWGYWIPDALAGGHASHFPGLLGPMVAALLLTPVVAGRAGLADLLRRMRRWRVAPRWYAACLLPFAAGLAGVAALWAWAPASPPWRDGRLALMPGLPAAGWLAVALLVLLVNGYGEETGWRGYAWPRLRERHSLGGAALVLAVPWALWHVPTFFIDSGMRGFPPLLLPGFLAGMLAGSLVLGWLYERTGGSILVVAVFHAMLNMASAVKAAEGLPAVCASAVVIAWAVLVMRHGARRPARLAAPPTGYRTGMSEPEPDRVRQRAGNLLPEERAAGTDDPLAQAEAILADSDSRERHGERGPDPVVDHHRADEAADPG